MTRSPRSSPERRGRLLLPALSLLAFLLAGLAPAGAQQAAPAEVRARARAALAESQFQCQLPRHAKSDAPEAPSSRGIDIPVGDPSPVVAPILGAGAFLAKVVFIVLLAVVLLLIVGWGVQTAMARRRGTAGPAEGSGEAPAEAAPERELAFEDASRLAAEGRYAEAIHALLLAAIRHFAERSRTAIQPSRTSRELVKLLPLGPDARAAFADLVRTVELSLFGGVPVDREDYERNLERFRALTRRTA